MSSRPHYLALVIGCAVSLLVGVDATDGSTGSIRGRVVDEATLRPVGDAQILASSRNLEEAEATTDSDGAFTLPDLAEGLYVVIANGTGYLTAVEVDVRVVRGKVAVADFALVEGMAINETVVVTATGIEDDPLRPVNATSLDREQIRRNPGTAGDVLRGLDTLPGVTATGEFASFSVRGRGPQDNLIFIDDIPFDKVIHFDQSLGEQDDVGGGGRFSIFAPNLIGGVEFVPGGWGAKYAGKNGSLLRLDLAEGNRDTPAVSGRADVTGWEINYDGPSYIDDNTSVLLSARHLAFENLFDLIGQNEIGAPTLTDVIFKSVSRLSPRHIVELLAVYAPEEYERTVDNVLESENFENVSIASSEQNSSLLGVTWRWLAGSSVLVDNVVYLRDSSKRSRVGESYPDLAGPEPTAENVPVRADILRLEEGEREIGWRGDLRVTTAAGNTFTTGARVTSIDLDFAIDLDGDWNRFVYDQDDVRASPEQKYIVLTPERVDNRFDVQAIRSALFAEYAQKLGAVTLNTGLRYDYDGIGEQSLWSPRAALNLAIDERTRASLAGGIFHQAPRYLELAANPGNADLEHERSTQLVLGISRYLRSDLRLSAEAYYQALDNLIVEGDRASGAADNSGDGSSVGIDLVLRKRLTDRWSGSASYSLSRARRNDNRGAGDYDAEYSRPHYIGLGLGWEPSDRWALSAKWKYASGRPTDDFIVHADVLDDPELVRYSKEITRENTTRLKAFHTLNVRVDYRRRFGPLSLIAFVDFINIYARENIDTLQWDERRGVNIEQGLSAFPTFGLKFEF